MIAWLLACATATEAAPTPEEAVPVEAKTQPTGPRGKAGGPRGGGRARGGGITVEPDPTILAREPAEGETPPLHFFYAIHAHMGGEHLPYHDLDMTDLDRTKAENMLATVEAITETAARYDIKLTVELVAGTAKGLAEYEGEDHVWRRLREAGHEIGLHTHKATSLQSTANVITDATGGPPTVGSGMMAWVNRMQPSAAQGSIASELGVVGGLGMASASANFSPADSRNPLATTCSSIGEGNDMWSVTGNLLFPWRPSATDPCVHDPNGPVVVVDHVPMSGMLVAGRIQDTLDDTSFGQLTTWFDNAITYMELYKPGRPAAWGFVTHLTEYVPGRDASMGPDAEAIAALDRFFAHVHEQAEAGRVTYATVSEIAAKVP